MMFKGDSLIILPEHKKITDQNKFLEVTIKDIVRERSKIDEYYNKYYDRDVRYAKDMDDKIDVLFASHKKSIYKKFFIKISLK